MRRDRTPNHRVPVATGLESPTTNSILMEPLDQVNRLATSHHVMEVVCQERAYVGPSDTSCVISILDSPVMPQYHGVASPQLIPMAV